MSSGIQLVALTCLKCGSKLNARSGAVFLYCAECGSGFEINDKDVIATEVATTNALSPIPVYFARLRKEAQEFIPFWAFDAKLEIGDLQVDGSQKQRGFIQLFRERGALRLYVAAYAGDLEQENPRSQQLTFDQPQFEFLQKQKAVQGIVISQRDARKIADYLFLMSEIERKDMLRNLSYNLQLENPSMFLIAF